MNLLIVDDEILAVQGILDGVEWDKLSFDRVLTANSYAQAVNIFLENQIDVMLCDIEMPYGIGTELVQWVIRMWNSARFGAMIP
jgi:two-component system response regulator YesN